mmetsp:Transcript_11473/g.16324  ORF Transcript_11473/g.16324 Transcript_11473/m.16324 type:complete len:224 (+) Transcript_11473:88-759(+)
MSESVVGSYGGTGARRFRTGTANVDETLFGAANNSAKTAPLAGKDVAIVGKDTVQVRHKFGKRAVSNSGVKSDVVVIAASELNRLRENATMLSRDQEIEAKARAEAEYEERMRKSKERKERMMQMEEERKRNALMKDQEKDSKGSRNSVMERAKQMIDEDMDDVKHMNQMMLTSFISLSAASFFCCCCSISSCLRASICLSTNARSWSRDSSSRIRAAWRSLI